MENNLLNRLTVIEQKMQSLYELLYTTHQNVLHCASILDTHIGPIDEDPIEGEDFPCLQWIEAIEPAYNDGWEPACDSEEMY
jgi:hypothetical protein